MFLKIAAQTFEAEGVWVFEAHFLIKIFLIKKKRVFHILMCF